MTKLFKYNGKEKDLTKERNERLIPVAQKIIGLIVEMELPMGNVNAHDNPKFTAAAKTILEEMLDANVKYVDIDFLFQLALQPLDNILQIVKKSLSESFNSAETKLFRKEYREITLVDLDRVLKEKL